MDAFHGQPESRRKGCFLTQGCFGCCMGCLMFLVLVVVGIIFFFQWLLAPATVIPAESMIGPDDKSFVLIHVDPAKPGVSKLAARVVEDAMKTNPATQSYSRADLETAIQRVIPPAEGTVVWTRDADMHLLFISTGRLKGLFKMVYDALQHGGQDTDRSSTSYQGEVIHIQSDAEKKRKTYSCLIQNNILAADAVATIQQAIDRVHAPPQGFGGSSDIKDLYRRLGAGRMAVGILTNEGPVFESILLHVAGKSDAPFPLNEDQVKALAAVTDRLGFTFDLTSADTATVRLIVDCKTAGQAAKIKGILDEQGQALVDKKQAKDLKVAVSGQSVTADLTLLDIGKRVEAAKKKTPTPTVSTPSPEETSP